ncbi:MAG: hypothetical protein QG614_250 [Patescibacteria group bacterium]|nr:hypothetical protein [Patescibacteria group bacterium]
MNKKIFSNLISLLILTSFVLVFLSTYYAFWSIVFLLVVSICGLIVHGFKNKKVSLVVLFSILSLTLLYFLGNFNKNNQIVSSNKENINTDTSSNNIKNENVENMLQNFSIMIDNGSDNNTLLEYYQYMITVANTKLNKSETITYLNLAKVYEAGYLTGLLTDRDYVLNAYYEYCKLEPNEPECYASIARFLALDKIQKDEAYKFANRALELAKSEQDIVKYNALIEYISKL